MDDENGTGRPPDDETVTEGPATPDPPRPSIEAYLGYKNRLAADADGSIGEMMKSYADAQPDEFRARLENDVDAFTEVWDKFAAAFPPRPSPSPAPQAPPPPPREYAIRPWELEAYERKARRTTDVIGPWNTLPPGVMTDENTGQRQAAAAHNKEISTLRQRARAGDKESEYLLASKLFGDASKWKPDHGPDNG